MQSEDNYFTDAEKNWDLSRLYTDLDSLNHNSNIPLTTQKAIIRGLLEGYNVQTITNFFIPNSPHSIDEINQIVWQIHERVRQLTNRPLNDTQSLNDIIEWLESAGYKKDLLSFRYDWGTAPDVITLYGYAQEQILLKKWLKDQLPLMTIWGRLGVGKTTLVSKIVKENQNEFEMIMWRSLAHTPSFHQLIGEIIQIISPQTEQFIEKDFSKLIPEFIKALQQHKCLVILDDWDRILEKQDSKIYGELLQRVDEVSHQSCLIIISAEKPEEIELLEGDLVRSLHLKGLGEAAKDILKAQRLSDEHLWTELLEIYQTNPLNINKVARTIKTQYGGSVSAFLQVQTFLIAKPCQQQLEQQLQSLSPLEVQILKILATTLQPLSQLQLREVIDANGTSRTEAVTNLLRKALIDTIIVEAQQCLTLVPLVREQIIRQYRLKKNIIVNQPQSKPLQNPSQQSEDRQITPASSTIVCSDSPYPALPSFKEGEGVRSINHWTRFGGLAVGITVIVGFILAGFTPYNVTVKAKGTLRPVGELPIVEAEIPGLITEIRAEEHQKVKQGDILAIVDDSQFQTQKRQLKSNLQQLEIQNRQLGTQVKAQDNRIMAEKNRMESVIEEAKAELRRQERNYQDKKITTLASVEEAKANFSQAKHDLEKVQVELKSAQATLQSAKTSLEGSVTKQHRYQEVAEGLSINQLEEARLAVEEKKAAVVTTLSQVQAQKQIIESRQQAVKASQERLRAALAALNPSNEEVKMAMSRIEQEKSANRANVANLIKEKEALLQQQTEINKQIQTTRLELQKVAKDLDKTLIKAVADGTIFKKNFNNSGQNVQAGQKLFTIVPENAPLEIKAAVAPQDKNYLEDGAGVHMKVSACPYPSYGTLKGKVTHIAQDTTQPPQDETKGISSKQTNIPTAFYEVIIKPEKLSIGQGNNQCVIELGLEGDVDIIAREETILQFFLRKARLIADL